MSRRRKQARRLPVRVVARPDGTRALEVGGVVQSVVPAAGGADDEIAGYWTAMLPERCPFRAALLGLGGGTIARLLATRCPGVQMVGVERDEAVLATARAELGLDEVPGLTVMLADAFAWVAEEAEREPGRYDLVCLDLFDAGRLALGALATPFLRQVARLLSAEGTLAVNLMVTGRLNEQLHRLQRVFALDRTVRVRGNLVVHLHTLPNGAQHADDACALH
jgi:spermidine synthase